MCGSSMHSSNDFHSANTWIGANTSHVYTPTSTSHVTGNNVVNGLDFVFMRCLFVESLNQQAFGYITGGFNGKFLLNCSIRLELTDSRKQKGYEVTDQITLGPGLVIPSQSMGVAKKVGYYSFYYLQIIGFLMLTPVIGY